MSREVRLHEPVLIVYTEYHPKRADNELDEVKLKVKQVSTFEEAAWLEHEILTKWAQRVQDGGYIALPWSPDFGSPTMQLLAKLYALTMHADEIVSHEKPILPKEEREQIDLPPVISLEWLANWLGTSLQVPVEAVTEKSEWYNTGVCWRSDAANQLASFYGKGAKKEMLLHFTSAAKMVYDEMPKDSVLALGLANQVQADFVDRLLLFFKMKRPEPR